MARVPAANDGQRLGRVVIVGVGLIGGSIGHALRARGLCDEVVGLGRSAASLDQAVKLGAIHRGTTDAREAVATAEVIVVCTPVDRISDDIRTLCEAANPLALLTDAGSCKRRIVEAADLHPMASTMFVGAHPLAGAERSGVASARADLFADRVCVLTPSKRTPADRAQRAHEFWSRIGCRIVLMSASEHDEIVAFTSHLPHAVSAALAATVPTPWQAFAAGAYRDGTRVAGADAGLWTAIFRDNRGNLLRAIDSLEQSLDALKYALMNDDKADIERWWEQARARRIIYESQNTKPTA